MSLIYKASFPNGKVYIGQTTQTLENRKYQHKRDAIDLNRKSPFFFAISCAEETLRAWKQNIEMGRLVNQSKCLTTNAEDLKRLRTRMLLALVFIKHQNQSSKTSISLHTLFTLQFEKSKKQLENIFIFFLMPASVELLKLLCYEHRCVLLDLFI